MTIHVYIADQAKGFNFTVVLDAEDKDKAKRVQVRFSDGQFKTEDDKLAEAIDAIREINPGIARRCRKADVAAAEEMARKHRATTSRTGAFKGGVTADAAKRAMDTSLQERDLELRTAKPDTDEFAKDNLQLTEKVETAPIPVDPAPITTEPKPTTTIKLGNVLTPKITVAE